MRNISKGRGALVAVLALTLLALRPILDAGPARLLRHPYLQQATPSSMVLVWRTSGPILPYVRFGSAPDALDDEVGPEQIVTRVSPVLEDKDGLPALHSAPPDCYQYEAYIDGLLADQRYYYEVLDDEEVLAGGDPNHFFRTSVEADTQRALRFWVVGDSGTGGERQREVYAGALGNLSGPGALDGYLHVGDMAYPDGTDQEFQEHFFAVYRSLLCNTVCWPTMGNHEGHTSDGKLGVGPYYDAYVVPTEGEAGGVPSGTESYYSFDVGPVHLVCLNSFDVDRRPLGEMASWLRADLEATEAQWLIAFWHHPAYTMGTHNSDRELELLEMRTYLMPILEAGGVDLVLAGHSHIYERSMLIDGAYDTPTVAQGVILDDGDGREGGDGAYRKSPGLVPRRGTVAIVAGHGGAGIGRSGTLPIMRSVILEHGSVMLEIDSQRLEARMIDRFGKVRDSFVVDKSKATPPAAPVENPWHVDGPEILVQRDLQTGVNTVEVQARPATPDAAIYYTLDGLDPTLTSARYQQPLALERTVEFKAFSWWDGGRRISPVASRWVEWFEPGVHRDRLFHGVDDVEEDGSGHVNLGSSDLDLGIDHSPQVIGLRFRNLNIPRGARLQSVHVQFTAKQENAQPTELTLWAEASGAAAPFEDRDHNVSQRERTEAQVVWQIPPWDQLLECGEDQRSPDLADLLEEVVMRPDWQPGNAVVFILAGSGRRAALSRDRGERAGALLQWQLVSEDHGEGDS